MLGSQEQESWPSPFTGCSTWERGLCNSPRQHSGGGPDDEGTSEPAPMVQTLKGYSTWESMTQTLTGKHSRASSGGVDIGKPV